MLTWFERKGLGEGGLGGARACNPKQAATPRQKKLALTRQCSALPLTRTSTLPATCARSLTTPAHPSSDFKWIDYSPRVFRRLR